jgi:hypothetical protein
MYIGVMVALLLASFDTPAQQSPVQQRTALIIGNADYLSGPLKNTVNDARSMARALRKSGFDVILREDVSNKDELKRVIRDFGTRLQQHGTGLFYYAGHGLQVDGYNFIVPVNAVINSQEEVEYECVDVGFVLAMMESSRTDINIVILDACRNNPFARSFRSANQGLASMSAPTGTIIAYATGPNAVAADGEGVNGLYTQELLKQINAPGLRVEDVFKNVRRNVLEQSGGVQTPWETSSLIGDFYFNPEGEMLVAGQGAPDAGAVITGAPGPGSGSFTGDNQDQSARNNQAVSGNEPPAATNTQYTTAVPAQGQDDPYDKRPEPGNISSDKTGTIADNIPFPYQRQKSSAASFRWRATQEGVYYLELNKEEISKQTVYQLRGDDLHVYHPETDLLFVLKSFVYRMDGMWRSGKGYK